MDQKLGQPRSLPRTNLAVNSLSKIEDTRPDNEPPTLIAKAVLRGIEGEGIDIVRVHGIADETAGRMGIQANHEEEREMMCIPEGFEALGAYLVVSGRVHQDHQKQHEMACNATSLCVMDLKRNLCSDLYKERERR